MAVRVGSARRSWRFLICLAGGLLFVNALLSLLPSFALPSALADGHRSLVDFKTPETDRYRPITIFNLEEVAKRFPRLAECLDDIRLSSLVFPFKVSPYVLEELIDWQREGSIRDDPFYRSLARFHGMRIMVF
ncbi:unnamed protein product [Cladocopium goreaui]|uniref:Lysine 2,3-aminomutase n=1 Tax=Cladocopium goreaui TaxID=2562237 RepID=A0A9P1GHG8_9DINO|nr:unnamed protein product [Cladocopium goreaui]